MQLVYKTDDINEANRLCALFVEKGVPSIVEENSLRNTGTHVPQGNEIWIYVNSQYQDAIKLIDDPDHVVSNPISPDEFAKFYKNNESASLGTICAGVIKYGLTFVAIVVVVLTVLFNFSA